MSSTVINITFDCADARALAEFWSAVTGKPMQHETLTDGEEYAVVGPDELPRLVFVQVPERKSVKNRLHLDIAPTGQDRSQGQDEDQDEDQDVDADRRQQEEVDRLIGLGATFVDDRRRADGPSWVVLADPEGNEFCVER